MAHKCPACSAELDGFTTQEKLQERINETKASLNARHQAEKDALQQQLTDAQASLQTARSELASVADLKAEAEAARAQLAQVEQATTLNASGLPDQYHGNAVTLWQAHNASLGEGEEAVSLADWLNGPARSEGSVLAAVLPPAGEEQPPAAQHPGAQPPARTPRAAPSGNTGTQQPPRSTGKWTDQQVADYIAQNVATLPRDQRAAAMSELRGKLGMSADSPLSRVLPK